MSKLNFNLNGAADFSSLIKVGEFDYIDFGCSKGGSLLLGQQAFSGKRGLGIDCEDSKVELTRSAGFDAVKYNIHDIPDDKLVRFVIMSHFLEHVPDPADVFSFIQKACSISTEFVYIQQPYFDSDSYLARHGLKLFWSDWRGHPNRMTSLELWIMLRNLREKGMDVKFSIHFYHHIVNSCDSRIHSILSPIDQHEFAENKHPGKGEIIEFQEPVFSEIRVLITMPGVEHSAILKNIKRDCLFIDEEEIISVNHFHESQRSKYETNKSKSWAKLVRCFKKT